MRTFEVSTSAITADQDGIAQSQTPGGAGNLTLNGAAVVAADGSASYFIGKARLNPPRRVTITAAADDSGKQFIITGTDRNGSPLVETVTGPNATTVTSNYVFSSVTSVRISAAAAGAIEVGFGAECISPWIFLSQSARGHVASSYQLDVTGTVNCDIERTYRNILRERLPGDYDPSASDVATAQTADAQGNLDNLVAVRLVQNSGTGSATLRVVQSSV